MTIAMVAIGVGNFRALHMTRQELRKDIQSEGVPRRNNSSAVSFKVTIPFAKPTSVINRSI